jgi:hypothetical protein
MCQVQDLRLGSRTCRTKSAGDQERRKEGGILEFGTEVINTADGSLAVWVRRQVLLRQCQS